MKIKTSLLIDELVGQTKRASATVSEFKKLDTEELHFKKTPDQWNILECIEHLNLYGNFYLPEIEKQLLSQPLIQEDLVFKSGLVGNYFVKLMSVQNGKVKKMKSPSDKNPAVGNPNATTLSRFLKQQELLLSLLEQARQTNLTKTKTAISLTPLVRLRLGDTLRFLVAHIQRHVTQAERTQY